MNSGTHVCQLIAVLETNYIELLEHPTSHFHEGSSLAKRLKEMLTQMLTHCRRQNLPQVQELSAAIRGSPIEDYLSSNDLPILISTLEPSAVFHVAQFGLYSRATEISPRSGDHTSTESMSASVSLRYGITFSGGSDTSMVSNSCFMAQ